MEEKASQVSINGVALKYGLINGLIGIIFFVILDFAGQATNSYLQWIGVLILAVVMYFAHKAFKEDGDGFLSYGQGLGIGTLMSLYSAILSSIFTFVYVKYINTSFIENIREMQRVAMEEEGMSDAQIEQAMEIAEKFSGPTAMLIFGIVFGVFFGFLVSLVISAITKRSRPEFE